MTSRERDKMDVPMTCADCGKKYTMKYKSLRLSKTDIHRCKDCTMKALQKKLYGETAEEKANLLKKRNAAIKNAWAKQTPEKKKQISDDRIRAWSEDKQRKEELKKRLMQRWSNASEDDKKRQGDILGKGRDQYWMDPKHREFHSERARKKWYAQSIEEQKRILKAALEGIRTYYANESPELREERLRSQSTSMKNWWNSLTKEEFEAHMKKYQMGMRGYFDELGSHEPNRNEKSFIEILRKHWIEFDYIYYNKIKHPDFDNVFPNNPIRPGVRILPYHAWDFIIHFTDKDILIDVDGSIHDKNSSSNEVHDRYGNKFVLYEYIQFNDSQRPYQTDGMDAYIIECYDDNMTDETLVRNVYTDEKQRLKDFLIYLEWESLSDEDKKDVIKFAMK